jgi:hypothetical protein
MYDISSSPVEEYDDVADGEAEDNYYTMKLDLSGLPRKGGFFFERRPKKKVNLGRTPSDVSAERVKGRVYSKAGILPANIVEPAPLAEDAIAQKERVIATIRKKIVDIPGISKYGIAVNVLRFFREEKLFHMPVSLGRALDIIYKRLDLFFFNFERQISVGSKDTRSSLRAANTGIVRNEISRIKIVLAIEGEYVLLLEMRRQGNTSVWWGREHLAKKSEILVCDSF